MSHPQDPLSETLRSLGEAVEAELVDHPSPEQLLAYHRRELSETDAEALREHLACCRECARVVLAAPEFFTPPDEEPPALAPELAAVWEKLAAEIAAEESAPPPDPLPFKARREARPGRARAPRFSARNTLAVAASALLAAGLAFAWGLARDRDARELARPRFGVPVASVQGAGASRSGESPAGAPPGAADFTFAPGQDVVLLALTPEEVPEQAAFRARILDPRGKVVFEAADLHPQPPASTFNVELRRAFFSPGAWCIELFARVGSEESVIDSYTVLVPEP